MATYRINYNKVISQANDIKTLSSRLGSEINTLQNLYANVKSEWKGPAADEFLKKINGIIDDLKKTRDKMSKISETIEETAAKIKKEDEKSLLNYRDVCVSSPV